MIHEDCFTCVEMEASGQFSDKEIADYHDSKLTYNNFTRIQRETLDYIFDREFSDEEEEGE